MPSLQERKMAGGAVTENGAAGGGDFPLERSMRFH